MDETGRGKIKNHKELRVWQNAMDAAIEIFELTKLFPAEERFGLTDQVRRSSRSVPANIPEAWRKRRYKAAFIAKLSDAEGESCETQTWIEMALRCKYINPDESAVLDDRYEHILSQIVTMINQADEWTVNDGGKR